MPGIVEPAASVNADLPPRTWRRWWLERPKWLRIGCWVGVAVISLFSLLAVRIVIGLSESRETREFRQRGAEFRYRELPAGKSAITAIVRFIGRPLSSSEYGVYETISDGMLGRSPQNVALVYLKAPTRDDIERCVTEYPNLKELVLRKPGQYSRADWDELPESCRNASYHITSTATHENLWLYFDE
jgi:hypothetical protein